MTQGQIFAFQPNHTAIDFDEFHKLNSMFSAATISLTSCEQISHPTKSNTPEHDESCSMLLWT